MCRVWFLGGGEGMGREWGWVEEESREHGDCRLEVAMVMNHVMDWI